MEIKKLEKNWFLIDRISSLSHRLYNDIYTLDKNGFKNSEQFSMKLKHLKTITTEKYTQIEKLDYDYDVLLFVASFILKTFNHVYEFENWSIFELNELKRNTYDLSLYIIHQNNDFSNIFHFIKDYNKKFIDINSFKNFKIISYLETTFLNLLLFSIENSLTKSHSNFLKNDLIKLKYKISFMNPYIETLMIFNNFNVLDNTFVHFNNLKNYENFDEIKDNFGKKLTSTYISKLAAIKNNQLNDYEGLASMIFYDFLINAAIGFMDKSSLDQLKFLFESTLSNQDNTISQGTINQAFKNYEKNKSKINIIIK